MNIGIVTTWFERGAAYVSKAYMEVLSREHTVFIYARGGEEYAIGDSNWDADNVTWAPRYGGFKISRSLINMYHFERWIDLNDINVVIFNEEHDITPVIGANKLGVVTGAYVDYYREDNITEFNNYDFLLCNTKRHYSVFSDHKNCIYIPWGTDVDIFKPKKKFEVLESEVKFFHSAGMGGLNFRKGTDLVIKAFGQIKGAAKLVVHSQKGPEHYGLEISTLIKEDSRISFITQTVSAPGLYHLGDVFVYPSRLEGIGLCMVEALACGLPIIVPDEEPMKDFVVNDYSGYTIKILTHSTRQDGYFWPVCEPDLQDLSAKMQFYIDHPDLIPLHKRNARQMALTKFNWFSNALCLSTIILDIHTSCKKVRHRANSVHRMFWLTQAALFRVNRWITFTVTRLLGMSFDGFGRT